MTEKSGYKVIEVRPTPNPNAMRYILDRPIVAQPASFCNAEAAVDHELAGRLFGIDGVERLLMLNDSVTVNRRPGVAWAVLNRKVKQVLAKA